MRGWKIMAVFASCFVPKNNDIYNLILNFLFFEMQNAKDSQIINHIKYIFVRMIKTKEKESRKFIDEIMIPEPNQLKDGELEYRVRFWDLLKKPKNKNN